MLIASYFIHSGLSSSPTVWVLVLHYHQPPTRRHICIRTHTVMHMHIQYRLSREAEEMESTLGMEAGVFLAV